MRSHFADGGNTCKQAEHESNLAMKAEEGSRLPRTRWEDQKGQGNTDHSSLYGLNIDDSTSRFPAYLPTVKLTPIHTSQSSNGVYNDVAVLGILNDSEDANKHLYSIFLKW